MKHEMNLSEIKQTEIQDLEKDRVQDKYDLNSKRIQLENKLKEVVLKSRNEAPGR